MLSTGLPTLSAVATLASTPVPAAPARTRKDVAAPTVAQIVADLPKVNVPAPTTAPAGNPVVTDIKLSSAQLEESIALALGNMAKVEQDADATIEDARGHKGSTVLLKFCDSIDDLIAVGANPAANAETFAERLADLVYGSARKVQGKSGLVDSPAFKNAKSQYVRYFKAGSNLRPIVMRAMTESTKMREVRDHVLTIIRHVLDTDNKADFATAATPAGYAAYLESANNARAEKAEERKAQRESKADQDKNDPAKIAEALSNLARAACLNDEERAKLANVAEGILARCASQK